MIGRLVKIRALMFLSSEVIRRVDLAVESIGPSVDRLFRRDGTG